MHDHHITYNPEVKKRLCVAHHEEITIINGIQGRKYRRQLSNNHRWWIWYQWIDGKLKPRKTKKAMEYIEEMRRGPEGAVVVREIEIEPLPVQQEPENPAKKRRSQTAKKKTKKPAKRLKPSKSAKKAQRRKQKRK